MTGTGPSDVSFLSVGAPPERHADRVIAAMLRDLAKTRALVGPAIGRAFKGARDGGPRGQKRMAARIQQAGAMSVDLVVGTRGRYTMVIYEMVGWNPAIDKEIAVGDPIPEKPWVGCILTSLHGRGHEIKSSPLLFITHHSLSRAAQRFSVRTPQDIITATWGMFKTVLHDFVDAAENDEAYEAFFAVPPQGRRMRLSSKVTIVVQRHRSRKALVVATVVPSEDDHVEQGNPSLVQDAPGRADGGERCDGG